jgi:uncharacterized membrane protein YfcA
MAFSRILLACAAVTAFFAAWRALEQQIRNTGEELRPVLPTLAVEAGLLTLVAGLWFGSLGAGGTPLLFFLLGALMEVPSRLRGRPLRPLPWKPIAGGIVRVMIAGLILQLTLG